MEKAKLIIYWVTTGLVSFGMLGSGIAQLLQAKEMVAIITHIGFPLYIMYILGIWKILAVIALLVPGFKLIKEWAYAGLFFAMTGAFISHLAVGDSIGDGIGALMQTIFIILSWYFRPESRRIVLN